MGDENSTINWSSYDATAANPITIYGYANMNGDYTLGDYYIVYCAPGATITQGANNTVFACGYPSMMRGNIWQWKWR